MISPPSYSSSFNDTLQNNYRNPSVRPMGHNILREEKRSSTTLVRLSYLLIPLSHVRSHLLGSKIKGNFLEFLLILSQSGGC